MARPQFVQARTTVLDVSISDTENTEIVIQKLVAVGNVPLSMADFGEILELTFNPGGANEEIVSCTGFTVADDGRVTINAGILRARSGKTPYTSGGQAYNHAAGTPVIVSNNAQMYDRILTYAEGMANAGAADATLTGKGLVEGATTAEINSGTELGATGAMLFVNPLYLASSIYGTRLPTAAEKAKLAEIIGVSFFAGDGSDGPLNVTSGTYTIDLSVKTVWQFSSVTIALGATVNFSGGTAGDKVPVIKCKGNFENAGTITTVGLGPAGGTGGAAQGYTNGTAGPGTNGSAPTHRYVDGTLPVSGRFGTGGTVTVGSDASAGTGGALAAKNGTYFHPYAINGASGGGGGGGCAANVGTPGAGSPGGAGSLGLILEVGGNFTNSGTITLNGQSGTVGNNGTGNGTSSWGSGAGGGGGGGGAGSFILRYQGTYSNTGSITVAGGAGGAGGSVTGVGASGGSPFRGSGGGGGGGGANSYNDGVAGQNGASATSNPNGGAGGAGGAGIIFMEKVTS